MILKQYHFLENFENLKISLSGVCKSLDLNSNNYHMETQETSIVENIDLFSYTSFGTQGRIKEKNVRMFLGQFLEMNNCYSISIDDEKKIRLSKLSVAISTKSDKCKKFLQPDFIYVLKPPNKDSQESKDNIFNCGNLTYGLSLVPSKSLNNKEKNFSLKITTKMVNTTTNITQIENGNSHQDNSNKFEFIKDEYKYLVKIYYKKGTYTY